MNGETGTDKLLQMVVSTQGNLLKGQNQEGLLLSSLVEQQSTQVEMKKAELYEATKRYMEQAAGEKQYEEIHKTPPPWPRVTIR